MRSEKEIRDKIVDSMGFNGDLIQNNIENKYYWIEDNSTFALLDYALGNKKRAEGIKQEIIQQFDSKNFTFQNQLFYFIFVINFRSWTNMS